MRDRVVDVALCTAAVLMLRIALPALVDVAAPPERLQTDLWSALPATPDAPSGNALLRRGCIPALGAGVDDWRAVPGVSSKVAQALAQRCASQPCSNIAALRGGA